MVEQMAVNHWVVGSSPSLGVYILCFIPLYIIRMPITKSAKKAANRSLVFQKRNNEFKLRMKMAIKKFLKSISKAEKLSQDDLNTVYKFIDKCKKVGVIKKNTAARKKSRVAKAFAKQK